MINQAINSNQLLFKFKRAMANIHGIYGGPPIVPRPSINLREHNGPGVLDDFSEPILAQQLRVAEEKRILFISGRRQVKNPHDQNYWDMLTFALCPTFKFLSLTFLISLIDIALFIFLVSVGLDKSGEYLLKVKYQTLVKYGGNHQTSVLDGQVYRLVSAMFLHIYFMHIFGNLITTFMFLSRIQYSFGFVRTLIIYLVSGISGNIFSLVCSPQGVKAGASTALFGIIGVIIGYLIINWNGLDEVGPQMKCQLYCTGLMIVIFIFIFTPAGSQIDSYGHLGGFLGGVWMSSINETILNNSRQKIMRIVFGVLMFAQLLICFLLFYLNSTRLKL